MTDRYERGERDLPSEPFRMTRERIIEEPVYKYYQTLKASFPSGLAPIDNSILM
jgi:hypothetical protein